MTRSEIDSLRQDSKAAMKLASALVAKNIEPINFAHTFYVTAQRQGGSYLMRRGTSMQGMNSIIDSIVASVLSDTDSPQKDKLRHSKAG